MLVVLTKRQVVIAAMHVQAPVDGPAADDIVDNFFDQRQRMFIGSDTFVEASPIDREARRLWLSSDRIRRFRNPQCAGRPVRLARPNHASSQHVRQLRPRDLGLHLRRPAALGRCRLGIGGDQVERHGWSTP